MKYLQSLYEYVEVNPYLVRVRDCLLQILMAEKGISEKDFTTLDHTINYLKMYFDNNPEVGEAIRAFEAVPTRPQYCAEYIYYHHFTPTLGISERKSHEEKTTDITGQIQRSHKLPPAMKRDILPLVIPGQTEYNNGRVYRLKGGISGCDVGADENGFFVATHRARSNSYPSVDKIPAKDIKFIQSTG